MQIKFDSLHYMQWILIVWHLINGYFTRRLLNGTFTHGSDWGDAGAAQRGAQRTRRVGEDITRAQQDASTPPLTTVAISYRVLYFIQ